MLLDYLYGSIIFGVIPGILLTIFVYAIVFADQMDDPATRLSAWAGFWAGLVVFAVYVPVALSGTSDPEFPSTDHFPDLSLPGLLVGIVTGF